MGVDLVGLPPEDDPVDGSISELSCGRSSTDETAVPGSLRGVTGDVMLLIVCRHPLPAPRAWLTGPDQVVLLAVVWIREHGVCDVQLPDLVMVALDRDPGTRPPDPD
jgi:hypothetical protein